MRNKKRNRSFEAIQSRISILRFEIEERREELAVLATELQNFEFEIQLDLKTMKEDGIEPKSLFV